MTNEQIQALAREYVEEMVKGSPSEELPNCLKNSMLTMNTEYVAGILRWLSQRYCLVEKRKLIEEYKSATANFNNASDPVIPTMDYYLGIMKFIESLFPEIAKEVES